MVAGCAVSDADAGARAATDVSYRGADHELRYPVPHGITWRAMQALAAGRREGPSATGPAFDVRKRHPRFDSPAAADIRDAMGDSVELANLDKSCLTLTAAVAGMEMTPAHASSAASTALDRISFQTKNVRDRTMWNPWRRRNVNSIIFIIIFFNDIFDINRNPQAPSLFS